MKKKDVSLFLYHHLCKHVIGTENHVHTVRLLNTMCDNLLSDNQSATIISGSFGEGIQMLGSDIDMMVVLKLIEVHVNIKSIVFNPHNTHFFMMTEDTKPGFAMLRLISSRHPRFRNSCETFRRDNYLSNVLFKKLFKNEISSVEHGPCISDKNGYLDFAVCLHSKYWSTSALKWTTRSNKSWPNERTRQVIINHGMLFVPIGSKGSPHEDLEWRISFSVAEKLLIYTFSHTQLLCYALMKILLKDVINIDRRCEDLLCSYYLKTKIFWISEELQPSVWRPDNLIPCFMRCFRRLIYCVQYAVCPHYIIPEHNLFDNMIEGYNRDNLIDTLHMLLSYGWRCVFLSRQISPIAVLSSNFQIDENVLYYKDINKFLESNIFLRVSYLRDEHTNHDNFSKTVYYILSCNSKKLKYMYAYLMSEVCNKKCQYIYPSVAISNKNQLTQYKMCLSYIMMNINHDTVSGWLMLASFFYKVNQYKKALIIISYALSKCTSEKVFRRKKMSVMQRLVVKWHAVQKQELVRLLKFVLVDYVTFETPTFVIPMELLIEESGFSIPPVVYAHFLSFLCQYHLNKVRECRNCLRDLKLTIAENYFIGENDDKARSYYCLGTALQLMGDNESAKKAFTETVKLLPDPYFLIKMNRLFLNGSL